MAAKLVFAVALFALVATTAWAGEIHDAIVAGDQARVAQLLRQDPSLIRSPNENPTRDLPLHTAATAGQVEIVRLLLDSGAEIDGLDSDGSTPLHCAAVSRKPEVVRLLLSRGADVNRRDRNGAYGLSFAASAGDSACIRMILDAGADMNLFTPQGTTLLHYACPRGTWWLVDRILAAGGDINRGNLEGVTPMHLVCQGRFPDRLEAMIARGANLAVADSDGFTPLHHACMFNRPEMARVLLEHGADANAMDDGGSTPLIWASRGDPAMVRLMLEHGADPNARNTWNLCPLLAAMDNGNPEVVGLLLKAGADPEVADPEVEMTPLHLAALLGYRDVAEALVMNGADVNHANRDGRLPLDTALRYGHRGVAELLAAHGAKTGEDAATVHGAKATQGVTMALGATSTTDKNGGSSAPFVMPKPGAGEAFVWSLGHSGWAVKTKGHLLIFDAGDMGRAPDEPSLRNGSINPSEIARENVAVFASHEHGDHYNPAIFGWKAELPRVRYLLGFRPRPAPGQAAGGGQAAAQGQTAAGPAPAPPQVQPTDYEYMPPGETRKIDGMMVTTIESNDSGVGFVVDVDGVTIFHAGDHANRYRDMSGPFKPQIDRLVAKGIHPDLAFLPVSGCNFGDQVAVRIGVEYQLAQLQPKVFFPMHGGRYGVTLRNFVTSLGEQYPATKKLAVMAQGDSFHYRKGTVL
jgi:ankyrin repeat protein/L-ascorbate metabolism protein UlaG (beta-lactamase superfamily)